jgi:hypothetical protein
MNGDNQKQPVPSQGEASWQYKPANQPSATAEWVTPSPASMPEQEEIIWSASEFVAHSKGLSWYSLLALVALVLSVLIYLLTQDVVSVGIVIFVALLLGISAVRKPRILNYQVNSGGLTIGQKFYSYHEFKSFAVMQEEAFSSVMFLPLKRFMPPISIYYDPKDEDQIIEVLSHHLPMENRAHDVIDSLVRRIRF